jgi:hypothetical protein
MKTIPSVQIGKQHFLDQSFALSKSDTHVNLIDVRSFGYNESWDSSPMKEVYMHETISDCCEAFFEQWNNACVVEDVCDSVPLNDAGNEPTDQLAETESKPTSKPSMAFSPKCDSALWHPNVDMTKCTNR